MFHRLSSDLDCFNVLALSSQLEASSMTSRKRKIKKCEKKKGGGDFPGSPVVKILCFQCRGHGFKP